MPCTVIRQDWIRQDSQFNVSLRGNDITNDLWTEGLRLDNNRSTVDRSGLGSIGVLYDVPVTQGHLLEDLALAGYVILRVY